MSATYIRYRNFLFEICLIYIFVPQHAEGDTLLQKIHFRGISCHFFDTAPPVPFTTDNKLSQRTMVAQYIDYIVFKGSLCSIPITNYNKIYACSCRTVTYNLAALPRYPRKILDTCGTSAHLKNSFSEEVMVCGSISFTKEPNTKMTLKMKVPYGLVLNITLWQIRSVAVSNLRDCQHVSSLILQDRYSSQADYLNTDLCGTYPSHSIFSKTNIVSAIWQTRILRQEYPSLILSYQPMAQDHAQAYIPSETQEEYNPKRYRVELHEEQTREAFVLSRNNAICISGRDRSFERIIWWAIQSILSLPEFFLKDFPCLMSQTEGAELSLYDALFLPESTQINLDSYLIDKINCSSKFQGRILRSTMGDLTMRLNNKIGETVTFSGTVTYAKMLCPGHYCSVSTSNISQGGSIHYLLSSNNKTVHKRLLISSDTNASGFILLSNITLFFEGYTLLPCIYGGIYIYELDPLTLVTKICTSWTSHIWDGGIERKDGSRGLHFGRTAVLILVRSIRFQSWGYIRGVASLTPCAGIINLDFHETNLYVVPGRGYTEKQRKNTYLTVTARHTNDCLVLQFISRDDLKLSTNTHFVFAVNSNITHGIMEHTLGFSVNYSSGILILKNPSNYKLCYFESNHLNIKLKSTEFSQPYWKTARPSRSDYYLFFKSHCYLLGIKIAVVMSYADPVMASCQTPSDVASWLTFETDRTILSLPLVPCGTLSLTGNMDWHKTADFRMTMNKPYSTRFCCLLRVKVLADRDFYKDIETLRLSSNWAQPGVSWGPFWKLLENKTTDPSKTIFDLESSPAYRSLNLLGRVWRLNCLHYSCGFLLHFDKKSSSLTDFGQQPLMNISFNFTILADTHLIHWVDGNKTKSNTFCSADIGKCYFLFSHNYMSWDMGNDLCNSKGMALLNTPSDFEWHFIETLLVRDTSILNRDELFLLGFLHLYHTVVDNSSALKWNGSQALVFQKWQLPQRHHMSYYLNFGMSKGRRGTHFTHHERFAEIDPYLKHQVLDLQPAFRNIFSRCTAFLILTSAQLEWIKIPCHKAFSHVMLICQRNIDVTYSSARYDHRPIHRQYLECEYGWVAIGNICHRMISLNVSSLVECYEALRTCNGSLSYPEYGNIKTTNKYFQLYYYYMYYWLDDPYKQHFYAGAIQYGNTSCVTMQLVERITVSAIITGNESSRSDGVACQKDMQHHNSSCPIRNQFQCGDGSCILGHYICDGVADCPNSVDEEECNHVCTVSNDINSTFDHPSLCYNECFLPECTCHVLYYHCEVSGQCIPASRICDGVKDCSADEDELECDSSVKVSHTATTDVGHYVCSDGSMIPLMQLNDLIPDCPGPIPDDEIDYYLYLTAVTSINKTNMYPCSPTATLCVKGFPGPCYPKHKICVYEKDRTTGAILYCRNGAHLDYCFQHECPGYFKCRNSYCVPYHYVCDYELDCPWGEDEKNCSSLQCPGLLRCRHDDVCVHSNMIGDHVTDCPLSGDDEGLTELKCAKSCECLGYAVVCSTADANTMNNIPVSGRKLTFQNAAFSSTVSLQFPSLVILDLSHNMITTTSLPKLHNLPKLRRLRLQNNLIQSIHKTFRNLGMLRILEMQMNPLKIIQPYSFASLNSLKKLNLSYMKLDSITHGSFLGLKSLQVLDLSYNPLVTIHSRGLQGTWNTLVALHIILENTPFDLLRTVDSLRMLKIVYVQSGIICRYLEENVTCIPTVVFDGRCCEFMKTTVQSFLLSVGIVLTIMSAATFIVWVQMQVKIIPKFLMCTLNISKLSLAAFPFYVTAMHTYHGRSFLFHKYSSLNSYHCKIIGVWDFLAQNIGLLTVFMALIHRFLVTAYPLKHIASPLRPYVICLAVAAFVMLFIPLYLFFGVESFASGVICHLIPFSSLQIKRFPAVFGSIIALQTLLQVGITTLHFMTFNTLKMSIKANIKATTGGNLKKQACKNCLILGLFHLISLIISFVLQMLPILWNFTDDDILMFKSAMMILDIMCPLLYTFGTGQFKSYISRLHRLLLSQ